MRLPAARQLRSRRTMFSMSMIASSTTTPTGDPEAGEDHRVDRRPLGIEDDRGGAEREGNREQADERGAPLEQKREQHEHDQDAAEDHGECRDC